MTVTCETSLLILISLFHIVVEGRLKSHFPMSEQKEESRGKGKETDFFSRQMIHGGSQAKSTIRFCGLVSQKQNYGQGIDLQPIYRNVNLCRITSVQTAEKAESSHRMPCTAPRMCVANESLVEQLALLDGLKEVTSALNCSCLDPRPPCLRKNNIRVFHWGTTYERSVDTGQCVGSCSKGKKTCHLIASKIVSVKGPNGAHCVEKVLRCSCTRSCHRVSFHQLYSATVFDENTSRNETLEQVIDVGRCVGECSGRKKGRCIHWVDNPVWRPGSNVPPKVCMLSSPPRETGGKCRPMSTEKKVLYANNGALKTVNVIKRCKCF